MGIPDQSHFNRVRDALWNAFQSNASVMVGAGFSRNSRKSNPNANEFPLWDTVANALCYSLYPDSDKKRRGQALAEASGTSGFLKLAQEYEVAFGRSDLHQKIKGLIPDEDYAPDDFHRRLLNLPWKDVFTTNWDTLLERTRPSIANRAYSVIRTPEDIPAATSPRIVKLHGTFPSHIPFIFTEEDYRTYPQKFAPFVNMVQQVMIESVMILIGFSGDDPNFLHWSGWVRDNLGDLAPKIYLAGWLDLSPHRRRMLEDRNVVPIDLAMHPKASEWPEHLRHQLATDWIISSFEKGKPYDITNWPNISHELVTETKKVLMPIESLVSRTPKTEPEPDKSNNDYARAIKAILQIWRHNRMIYPGWLIFPPSIEWTLSYKTKIWGQVILKGFSELPALEQIWSLYEFFWRKSKLLEQPSAEFEELAKGVLKEIECTKREISSRYLPDEDWVSIRSYWRFLALELLTLSRKKHDHSEFSFWEENLQAYLNDDCYVSHRVHYERCLWLLHKLNYKELDDQLNKWLVDKSDPMWTIRKASILAEINKIESARTLLFSALSLLRDKSSKVTVASESREGWALLLASALRFNDKGDTGYKEDIWRRSQELAPLNCDAISQRNSIIDKLRETKQSKEKQPFELGSKLGDVITFSAETGKQIRAYKAIRLAEIAGLPSSANHCHIATELFETAGTYLISSDPLTAIQIIFLTCNNDDSVYLTQVLSRKNIASLPYEIIEELTEQTEQHIQYILRKVKTNEVRDTFWITKLRVSFEVLSRLSLRLPSERAASIFSSAMDNYRNRILASDLWLGASMFNLLNRSWQTLSLDLKRDKFLSVLTAPIVGLDGFHKPDTLYRDPGEILLDREDVPKPRRDKCNENDWRAAISLIIKGLKSGGKAREISALRLVVLFDKKVVKDDEYKAIAEALWIKGYLSNDFLPEGTNLYDAIFFYLPHEKENSPEERFRRKWFSEKTIKSYKELNDIVYSLGCSMSILRDKDYKLDLSKQESNFAYKLIQLWIDDRFPQDKSPFITVNQMEIIFGLAELLKSLTLDSDMSERLLIRINGSIHTNQPALRLLPILLKTLPHKTNEIISYIKLGITSDDKLVAEEALMGVNYWLRAEMEEPPLDVVKEIGVIIYNRKKNTLNFALMIARWIFIDGSEGQINAISDLTLSGLGYLQEELRYDRELSNDGEDLDIPLLRWRCAHLALNMKTLDKHPTVAYWINIASSDPLPEVRHARPDEFYT